MCEFTHAYTIHVREHARASGMPDAQRILDDISARQSFLAAQATAGVDISRTAASQGESLLIMINTFGHVPAAVGVDITKAIAGGPWPAATKTSLLDAVASATSKPPAGQRGAGAVRGQQRLSRIEYCFLDDDWHKFDDLALACSTKIDVAGFRMSRMGIRCPGAALLKRTVGMLSVVGGPDFARATDTADGFKTKCDELQRVIKQYDREPYPYPHLITFPDNPADLPTAVKAYAWGDALPVQRDVPGLDFIVSRRGIRNTHRSLRGDPPPTQALMRMPPDSAANNTMMFRNLLEAYHRAITEGGRGNACPLTFCSPRGHGRSLSVDGFSSGTSGAASEGPSSPGGNAVPALEDMPRGSKAIQPPTNDPEAVLPPMEPTAGQSPPPICTMAVTQAPRRNQASIPDPMLTLQARIQDVAGKAKSAGRGTTQRMKRAAAAAGQAAKVAKSAAASRDAEEGEDDEEGEEEEEAAPTKPKAAAAKGASGKVMKRPAGAAPLKGRRAVVGGTAYTQAMKVARREGKSPDKAAAVARAAYQRRVKEFDRTGK